MDAFVFDTFLRVIIKQFNFGKDDPLIEYVTQQRKKYEDCLKKSTQSADDKSLQTCQNQIEEFLIKMTKERAVNDILDEDADDDDSFAYQEDKSDLSPLYQAGLFSKWTKDQVFIQPDIRQEIELRLEVLPTSTEKAAAQKLALIKSRAADQNYGQYAKDIWGGGEAYPLELGNYIAFLHSPAVAFLPIEDFRRCQLGVGGHYSCTIANRCHWIDARHFHIEMWVQGSEENEKTLATTDINIDAVCLYGEVMRYQVHQTFSMIDAFDTNWVDLGPPMLKAPSYALAGTFLEHFASAAWDMHLMMNCPFPAACHYIACGGEAPKMPPLRAEGRYTFFAPDKGLDAIELSIAPYLSPETVKRAYELIWRQYHGVETTQSQKRQRRMGDTTLNVSRFVLDQLAKLEITGEPSGMQWNEMYEAWKHATGIETVDRKNFRRYYQRGKKSIAKLGV